MTQTTIPNSPPDNPEADNQPHNVDAHMPPQPGHAQRVAADPVYATPSWNPDTNEWAPSNEQHSVWGVAEPGHGDDPTAEPMSESYGQAPSGTIPDQRYNLIDDVRRQMAPLAPPTQEHHHVVEEVEKGSPTWRVRHVVVQGATPTQLVEENQNRKRMLLRIIPGDAPVTQVIPINGSGTLQFTVPAGKTWTVQSINYVYTASAVVANRNVRVRFNSGANALFQFQDGTATTNGQIDNVTLAPGMPTQHAGGASPFTVTGPIPTMAIPAGGQIILDAVNQDAGDTEVGSITVLVSSSAGAGQASIFIAPRLAMSGPVAPQAWAKLVNGDGYLELKITEGVDAVVGNTATDISEVIVIEEIEAVVGGIATPPGAP